ncbi:LysR family transcriptional regulator [Palleronia rufa]|uniref:LysR family transcriptional regulator n=1 Tax=Palleronia rufa TaxID=1530186 RepID=UPI001F380023|nr:LysR family transcriptional regulator [Palleronia rufa]
MTLTLDSRSGMPSRLGSRIPLVSLIHTLAVAEYLNFRHAANALGVSVSTVSTRVKTLEEDLGILLFERHARGVRLTDAGHRFIEQVSAGVDQLDHAVKTAGLAASGECGRLRLGIHALIPRSFLAELIAQYRETHPGIAVEITESTARDAVIQLRSDLLDLAFVAGPAELPDFHSRRIWTEPLVAVLPERHPLAGQSTVTWPDLAGETFLVRYDSTGPQVHDHIILRLAGRLPPPSIQRFGVGPGAGFVLGHLVAVQPKPGHPQHAGPRGQAGTHLRFGSGWHPE